MAHLSNLGVVCRWFHLRAGLLKSGHKATAHLKTDLNGKVVELATLLSRFKRKDPKQDLEPLDPAGVQPHHLSAAEIPWKRQDSSLKRLFCV